MEDVLEPLGRFILRILKWIVVEAIIEFVLKGTGHVVLNLLTLGKYPRAGRDEGRTVAVGFVSLIVVFVCLVLIA
ncbi:MULTISPECIES: hypothetical protein [Alteromonas]|uniref:hypothetical protein n=1 Tax=Alteromonas TaxID=226 RepID=UPI0012F713C8|nr:MULTISPECIES: hypothetical protein [Alteromonas]NQY16660.1 hypothetical protein [Alteromonas sp.]QGX61800.1 hypothetical protein FJN15_08580 [Alteromonas mediterranea]|tara:strand:+ start:784 stop:1008 length:225 start_codon:yes stop_codon:yes gene_type:complete